MQQWDNKGYCYESVWQEQPKEWKYIRLRISKVLAQTPSALDELCKEIFKVLPVPPTLEYGAHQNLKVGNQTLDLFYNESVFCIWPKLNGL